MLADKFFVNTMNWLDTLLNLPSVCKFLQGKEWSRNFPSQYLARGRKLSETGKVLDIDHFIGSKSGFVGTARVQGTRSQPYKVSLTGKRERDGWVFWGTCTCPVSEDCKHVAALVYDLQKAIAGADAEGEEEIAHGQWLTALSEVVTPEKPKDTGESKRRLQALAFLVTPRDDGMLEVGFAKIGYPANKAPRVENPAFTPGQTHRNPAYFQDGDFEMVTAFQERLPKAPDTNFHWYEVRVLQGSYAATLLPDLFKSHRFFLAHEMGRKGDPLPDALREGLPIKLGAKWEVSQNGEYSPSIGLPSPTAQLIEIDRPYYLDPETRHIGSVDLMPGQTLEFLQLWLRGPKVDIETAVQLSMGMEGRGIPVIVPRPVPLEEEVLDHDGPKPVLTLGREDLLPRGIPSSIGSAVPIAVPPLITGRLAFRYGGEELPFIRDAHEVAKLAKEGYLLVVERDLGTEEGFRGELERVGLQLARDLFTHKMISEVHFDYFGQDKETDDWDSAWADFLARTIPRLKESGWEFRFEPSFDLTLIQADSIYAEVSEDPGLGIDWFQFDTGIVTTEGQRQSLMNLIANFLRSGAPIPKDSEIEEDQRVVVADELGKSFFNLPAKRFFRIVRSVHDLFDRPDDGLHTLEAACLCEALELDQSKTISDLRALGEQLKKKELHVLVPLPKMIKAELRDYQKEGFQWLQFLARHHLHGILADDMGLGKTLQTLAHIAAEIENGQAGGNPCLVVAPTSVVPNWEMEARKFTPSLKVIVLHGSTRKTKFKDIGQSDLVITSYALLQRDEAEHLKQAYHLAILDEAQYVKNPHAKVSKAACELDARHRICLSGTPMENHLGELWSLARFLMPGLLGNLETFNKAFRHPIERQGDEAAQRALNARVGTLILRRTKDQVAQELPPKTEIVHRIALNKEQQEIYESVRLAMDSRVRDAIADKGLARSQIIVLDALLRLRQICCHPTLIKTEIAKKAKKSAKLDFLIELLATLVREGRRILLFSQFTTMLAMIEEHLKKEKIGFVKITGATRNRKAPVEKFQEGKISVFLISLKAGGTGLNLTAADTVIHYDPWWNPAAENQATDRAHRIGQTNPVFVHKLICEGSIEERILDLQKKKSKLVEALLSEKTSKLQLDTETLKGLLAPLEV